MLTSSMVGMQFCKNNNNNINSPISLSLSLFLLLLFMNDHGVKKSRFAFDYYEYLNLSSN